MSEDIGMVFSACVAWFEDWVSANPEVFVDEWDLAQWMEHEMQAATQTFLTYGFCSQRARNDALMILRALYYEHFLFQQQVARKHLKPDLLATTRLPNLMQTTQKSAAWHNESRNMLSGHEFGPVCVGSVSERTAVIAKKCAPELTILPEEDTKESRTVFLTGEDGALSAFRWGWRYEPVARQLFEQCVAEGASVYDGLGRIKHPTLPRLGASPDGLIMSGPRAGRLVEIKCPITRKIDNSVPIRYYCQMQLQAEVCDVDVVEYVEVQFAAVAQANATEDIITKSKQPYIGKVCVVAATPDTPPEDYAYAYSPLFPATPAGYLECIAWAPPPQPLAPPPLASQPLAPQPQPQPILHESSIWYVKGWHNQSVLRNKRWWSAVGLPAYREFWKEADDARATGLYKNKALFIDSASDTTVPDEEEAAIEPKRWEGIPSA